MNNTKNNMIINSSSELKAIKKNTYTKYSDFANIKNIDRFVFKTKYFDYESLWQRNRGDYLFVFFTGANDRTKTKPPYFDRWSWNKDFPGAMLNISDPSLLQSEDLRLAWYTGNKNEYPVKIIVQIILAIARSNNIKNNKIVCYGSSGAGFTALAVSKYIKDSIAVAINSQTNCLKYYSGHVNDMIDICFDGLEEDQLIENYDDRLDMVKYYKKYHQNKVLIIQNSLDKFHYDNHYIPFVTANNIPVSSGFSKDMSMQSLLYTSDSGHGPEPKDMLSEILDKIGAWDDNGKKLYLSLGENCLTDNIINRHNLKSFSTPYSSGRTNLDYAIFCEKTNYITLINKEFLVYEKKGTINNYLPIYDSIFSIQHSAGFEFTHHDIINNKIHRESIQRKIDRMIDIKGNEEIVFFYHYRLNDNLNYSKIFEKATEFISLYKPLETNSKIILFSQKIIIDKTEREVTYEKINDSVHNFVFYTQYIWGGSDEDIFWARVDDDLIKIMIEKVENLK